MKIEIIGTKTPRTGLQRNVEQNRTSEIKTEEENLITDPESVDADKIPKKPEDGEEVKIDFYI